jgi:hypothetical protein
MIKYESYEKLYDKIDHLIEIIDEMEKEIKTKIDKEDINEQGMPSPSLVY